MNNHEFVETVARMRKLQREFFKTRPQDRRPSLIHEAKAVEAEVDAEIEHHLGQLGLFRDDPVATVEPSPESKEFKSE